MEYKSFLDELVTYPAKVLFKVIEDDTIIALLVNKRKEDIVEADQEFVLNNLIHDYNYVDGTITSATAHICVEAEIPRIENEKIKDMTIYITVACHKKYMGLDPQNFPGMLGNRRDNITRYVDKLIQGSDIFGIGKLSLIYVKTRVSSSGDFVIRELAYSIPDFNIRKSVIGG